MVRLDEKINNINTRARVYPPHNCDGCQGSCQVLQAHWETTCDPSLRPITAACCFERKPSQQKHFALICMLWMWCVRGLCVFSRASMRDPVRKTNDMALQVIQREKRFLSSLTPCGGGVGPAHKPHVKPGLGVVSPPRS